jgi:hypothetical protein
MAASERNSRTCLFTGDLLDAHTKIEHTIPLSIGGRIKSRRVSANRFNEAAGNCIDVRFAEAYSPIFNRLGSLTPSAHKRPSVPAFIRNDSGKYQFAENGRFERKGFLVEKDSQTRKVKSVIGSDPRAIAKHFGMKNLTIEAVPPPKNSVATIDIPLFDVGFEIAALKAILLTLDEQLYGRPDWFTRDSNLAETRELVRSFILENSFSLLAYKKIVMGFQYDKIHELQRLRRFISEPITPFEHVIMVSANPETRSIDAVWWVASTDPYGFRLCSDWRGSPFAYIVANGVLKDTRAVVEPLAATFSCRLDARRRALQLKGTTKSQMDALAREIGAYRREALQQATDHNERYCPEFVRDCVIRFAQVNFQESRDGTIANGLRAYLIMLFEWRLQNLEKMAQFEDILRRRLPGINDLLMTEKVTSVTGVPATLTWPTWHRIYTMILDDLRETVGLPGEIDFGHPILSGNEYISTSSPTTAVRQ